MSSAGADRQHRFVEAILVHLEQLWVEVVELGVDLHRRVVLIVILVPVSEVANLMRDERVWCIVILRLDVGHTRLIRLFKLEIQITDEKREEIWIGCVGGALLLYALIDMRTVFSDRLAILSRAPESLGPPERRAWAATDARRKGGAEQNEQEGKAAERVKANGGAAGRTDFAKPNEDSKLNDRYHTPAV